MNKDAELCMRPAPPFWDPDDLVCVKPAGHIMTVRTLGKKKRKIIVAGWHETKDGRKWPLGRHNMKFV